MSLSEVKNWKLWKQFWLDALLNATIFYQFAHLSIQFDC